MKDQDKTKEQVVQELLEMRHRILELEAAEAEWKREEEKLRESEETMRALLNGPSDSAMLIDTEGIIFVINEVGAKRFGKSVDELLGECVYDLLPPGVTESRRAWDDEVVRSGKPVRFEEEHEGSILDAVVYPVLDAGGKVKQLALFASDITKRKQVEEELWESQQFSSSLLSNAPNPILVVNPDTSIRYVNPAMEKLTGFSYAELIGKKAPYPWWIEETIEKVSRNLREAMLKGAQGLEELFQKKNGERFWGDIDSTPIMHHGELGYYLSNWVDITERKRAEESLKESGERYRVLFENSIEGVFTVDLGGHFTSANKAMEKLTGYPLEELVGISYEGFVPPEGIEFLFKEFNNLFRTGEPIDNVAYQIIRKNGETRFVEGCADVIKKEGTITGFQGTLRDITKCKQAEEALWESEGKYRSLTNDVLDSSAVGIFVLDKDFRVVWVNQALERYFGLRRDELIGKDKPNLVRERIKYAFEYPEIFSEKVLATYADNTYIEKFECHVLPEGEREERWLEHFSQPIQSGLYAGGRIEHYYNITMHKQMEAERREVEQRAQLASRLTTVGEMASGIAHEINNPLTSVIGFAQLLMRKDIPEDIKEEVKIINDSAQRVASIVKRLLAFARQRKPEHVYADINDIIESTLGMRAYAMETGNIKVITQLDPELPRTMADASQLQQVFLNIIVNAEMEMKLAHGRGKLLVRTETADNILRISFKDDGPGIAKENLGRILDPFFTTRKVGEGTGLGLSICHGIIAEHNGQLHVKSKLGKGATFIVELPIIAEEKQLGLPEPARDDSTKIRRAKILVVDDEPATLELLSQILTAEGHEVQTTEKAIDALERIKSERYSLILLDIKLPGMSGVELYRSIEKIAESLARRILFITGDVMGADTRDFFSKTNAPRIAKPFDIEQLKNVIDRMLAG